MDDFLWVFSQKLCVTEVILKVGLGSRPQFRLGSKPQAEGLWEGAASALMGCVQVSIV